jgi:opacity protein-like surface antigen
MKKYLLALSLFLFSSAAAFAQAVSCNLEGSIGGAVSNTGFKDTFEKLDIGGVGGLVGLGAGCDVRTDKWVAGLMGRYSFLNVDGTVFATKLEHNNLWEAAVRFGRDIGPVTPYVMVGWSWADVDIKAINTSQAVNGLLAGGGIDLALSPNILLRAEYAWHGFETFKIETTKISSDLHVARLAVVFRLGDVPLPLGGDEAPAAPHPQGPAKVGAQLK